MGRKADMRERVWEFARERILAGVPPTVREVQKAMGFKSSGSAREHLDLLVAGGRLVRVENVSRGLRLAESKGPRGKVQGWIPSSRDVPARPAFPVPILGRVPAGLLNLATEEVEGQVWVEGRPSGELFALRVKGESMTGAGILPGDCVVVRRQAQAESGQVVVALVDDEATVKILRRKGKRIELHPANPAFRPLVPDPEKLRILGRVVEVRRSYR